MKIKEILAKQKKKEMKAKIINRRKEDKVK